MTMRKMITEAFAILFFVAVVLVSVLYADSAINGARGSVPAPVSALGAVCYELESISECDSTAETVAVLGAAVDKGIDGPITDEPKGCQWADRVEPGEYCDSLDPELQDESASGVQDTPVLSGK